MHNLQKNILDTDQIVFKEEKITEKKLFGCYYCRNIFYSFSTTFGNFLLQEKEKSQSKKERT